MKGFEKYYSIEACFKILTNISQTFLIITLEKKHKTYYTLLDSSILGNTV